MIILTLPIRRTEVKVNGELRTLLRLESGLCGISDGTGSPFQESLITNPLKEFLNQATNKSNPADSVYLILEEQPRSNPGLDDNLPSLTYDTELISTD